MATMNISLTDDLKAFVEDQVAARSYTSASEYLRDLIRRQKEIEDVRQKLLDGASSPIEGEMDKAFFDGLRTRSRNRIAQ